VIVRILTEGQYEVPDDAMDALNELDAELATAIEGGDEDAFRSSLEALLERVRSLGTPVELDALLPSTLLLPATDASLAEVRDLLNEDGLIPG
jgi:PspA-Associated protein